MTGTLGCLTQVAEYVPTLWCVSPSPSPSHSPAREPENVHAIIEKKTWLKPRAGLKTLFLTFIVARLSMR
jgi:hypothetical protein